MEKDVAVKRMLVIGGYSGNKIHMGRVGAHKTACGHPIGDVTRHSCSWQEVSKKALCRKCFGDNVKPDKINLPKLAQAFNEQDVVYLMSILGMPVSFR